MPGGRLEVTGNEWGWGCGEQRDGRAEVGLGGRGLGGGSERGPVGMGGCGCKVK